MPANPTSPEFFCPYCQRWYKLSYQAEHVFTEEHAADVRKFKRSAAYRNRQGDLPFPPTLHDPPKLR